MRRVICVFLPTWPTDRWRRRSGGPPPDEPLVAAAQEGPRRVLSAVDSAARRLGLRPGLALAQAQALCPGLTVIEADPEGDAAGLARLAAWCLSYAPLVAPDPPDGIWIDVAGAAHLHGGEAALLGQLRRRLGRAGIRVRVAVADTPGAAWAATRCLHPETVLPPGGQRDALPDLPLRALRLDPATVAALAQLGLTRVGHLLDQPRGPLRLRFGEEPTRRLDQALDHAPEPLAYLAPPVEHAVRLAFPEPIGAPETLARVSGRLAAMLAEGLTRHGLGARRLDLVFRRVDGLDQSVSVGTARPSRDPRHLARLLAERLPQIDPGHGLDEARLSAPRVERLEARQLAAPGEEPDPDAMAELIDRLVLRLGPGRVFRKAPVESEWPERAVRRVAPLSPATGVTWPADLPRPGRLLPVPEPVAVLAALPDAPPSAFTWRGTRRRVARADGPERIFGEWWLADDEVAATRDYYRVEDETGARYWLFRDALTKDGARWWLHGLGEAGLGEA
ncbi:DNA polymerase Y family protein [Methylobacterium currus]|uniref:DNA polymerase Y family protein n=1 Tax=Methylobacterium currus TaxID=2051553 RepID=UPI001E4A2778|nr:DNA polymerase Y family protein [Methylobacterium currus]UHC15531.1 DNA polymerase Y family protein [Methylobacterium currus]